MGFNIVIFEPITSILVILDCIGSKLIFCPSTTIFLILLLPFMKASKLSSVQLYFKVTFGSTFGLGGAGIDVYFASLSDGINEIFGITN